MPYSPRRTSSLDEHITESIFAFDLDDNSWGYESIDTFDDSEYVRAIAMSDSRPDLDDVARLIAVSGELFYDECDLVIMRRKDGKMYGVSFADFDSSDNVSTGNGHDR